ncbi:MAG: hypothetical protein ACLPYS_08015 [Vulcanimicrobiaceae bacterium]
MLAALFERIERDYRSGVAAQLAFDEQMERVRSRPDLHWEPGEIESVAPHEEEKLRVARAMEACAEIILRTLDDLLSMIVVAFNGRETSLNVGPALPPGIPLCQVLDAVGDYVRHRSEWRITYNEKKEVKRTQLTSIRPLARVISGRAEVDGYRAYDILIQERSPMLRILDSLSGYSAADAVGGFERLKRTVRATASAIIDDQWQVWWDKRH